MYLSKIWPKFLLISLLLLVAFTAAQTSPTTEIVTAQNDQPILDEGLFEPAAAPAGQLDVTAAPEVLRSRFVTVNDELFADGSQDRLTVNPFAGVSWTAVKNTVIENPLTNSYTWTGRLERVENSQATFVINGDVIVGKIAMPGAIYELHYTGQTGIHEVVQINQGVFIDHEVETLLPPNETVTGNLFGSMIDPTAINAADNGSVMDVLVVYSPQARAGAGGTAAIEALIELAMAETNIAYENSQADQRVSLVHMYESPDDEKGNMCGSTGSCTDGDLALLRSSGDGYIDGIHALRNEYHADFVMLIKNSDTFCGLAYLQHVPASANFENSAFGVTRRACATGNYSFGHELGHNMGLRHDWFVDSETTPFSYAHGYVNRTDGWRTIMSYNDACDCSDEVFPCPAGNARVTQGQPVCSRLIYFSNDEVNYFGDAMGIPNGTSSACAVGNYTPDPSSCDADNESILNSNALSNSRFRSSQITWLGNSTNWNDPNNWEMLEGAVNRTSGASSTAVNRVPRTIDDVYIPAAPSGGNFPVISGDRAARNVVIASGASLTINSGSLTVYGDWEEQGSGTTAANGGTLILAGVLPQTIKLNNNSYFNNVEVGNGSGASAVQLTSNLHINGNLIISGSSSLSVGNGTIRVAGDWTQQDANSFNAGTSTVILDGTDQTVTQLAQGTTLLAEDFSTYDAYQGGAYETVQPAGWVIENNGQTVNWRFSGSFFNGGPGSGDGDGHAYRRWIDSDFAAADVWLFTSGIQMDTDAVYEISFDYGTLYSSSREDFEITLSTAQTAASLPTTVQGYTDVDNNTWLNETISNVTVPSDGIYYLGIHSNTDMVSGDDSLSIDDIVITELQLMSFYNLQVNSTTAAAFGQNLVVNNQLQINPNGVLDLSGVTATAEKTVINNGTIQETKDAVGSTTTDFIMIENAAGDATTYYGVQIINPAGSMGSTTVKLAGGQNCGLNLAKLMNRCYNITPTTSQSAAVRFYFSEMDRSTHDASTSNVWHWNGFAWVGASSTNGYTRSEATPSCITANGLGCYIEAAAVTDYSPFALAVSQPELEVIDNGADVSNGTGFVDSGATTIGNPITKDVIITNVGLTDLTVNNLTIPSGFTQIGGISNTVTAGTATTLTLQLDASSVNLYTGTVTFETNDSDESSFSFLVEGNVTENPEPEIQLFDGVINILDGSGQVNLGTTTLDVPVRKLLTVKNVGTADLTLGDLNVPAGYSGEFANTVIAPGSSTTFTLTLTAATPGTFNGTITFDNTDVSESLYDFTVTGNVVDTSSPEIIVLNEAVTLVSGSSTVNMGSTAVGKPIVKTLTVQNSGNGDLELSNLVVSGSGFSLASGFSSTTVAPSSSTTFAVQFNSAAIGPFDGSVSFDTNDDDEGTFTFDLTAEAEVNLYLPVILIP